MVVIQLVETNEGYLSVKDGTVVPFNFSLSDVRGISQRQGVFTRSFELEGSKENAILLNSAFDVNVVYSSATFDINKRQKCLVIQNGVQLRDELYLQLKKVNIENEIVVSYSVEIKDALADLFTEVNNLELTDLDFSEDNHQLTISAITDSFSNNSTTSNYKYHLTTNSDNVFSLTQFKPAIYGIKYWERIHQNAGFTFEWQDFDDVETQFDKYIHPCTRSVIDSSQPLQVEAENSTALVKDITAVSTFNITTSLAYANGVDLDFDTETSDPFNLFDPLTGNYTSNLNYPAGQSLIFTVGITVQFTIQNLEATPIHVVNNTGALSDFRNVIYIQKVGGAGVFGVSGNDGASGFQTATGLTIPASTTITKGTKTLTYDIAVSNINNLDELKLLVGTLAWRRTKYVKVSDGTAASVSEKMTFTNATLKIKPNTAQGYYLGSIVQMNNFIPDKVKQSDYLKDIIVMNNLWMFLDPSNPKKIIYKKRNTYLDEGEVKNFSKKICLEKGIELEFLPELSKKKKVLTYKQDKDTLNEQYEGATSEIYGQVEYTFQNEYVRDTEKITLNFSPTPIHKLEFGAFVPAINGAEPKHNMRVLLDNGKRNCGTYYITEAPGTNIEVNNYPLLSHFDDDINPTFDLNFAICDYYFFNDLQSFTNNGLFNLNYRRQFNQIDNGQMLRALFDLNEYDIQTFKPNDKWWVYGAYWHVNKIIDYNSNRKSEKSGNYFTRVELIPIDTEEKIKFLNSSSGGTKPVRNKEPLDPIDPSFGIAGGGGISAVINEWTLNVDKTLNSVLSPFGSVQVIGKNNVVLQNVKNALVVGNNLTVENEGITAKSLTIGGVVINEEGIESDSGSIPLYIEKTYAEMQALVLSGSLKIGSTYKITDEGIYIKALSENTLSSNATRVMRIVKNVYYTPVGSVLGVWKPSLTPSIGDLAIWGGRIWINNSGVNGTSGTYNTLNSNWDVQSLTNDTYYYEKSFFIIYDFNNNWVSYQMDDRRNVLGCGIDEFPGNPNFLTACDWGNEKIYNNKARGIFNNSNTYIYDNIVSQDIGSNENGGRIYGNIAYRISRNKNTGNIKNNVLGISLNNWIDLVGSTTVEIQNNRNNGFIQATVVGNVEDPLVNK